jgi:hypothetical protein
MWNRTQDLTLARQALYHLSHSASPSVNRNTEFRKFSDRISSVVFLKVSKMMINYLRHYWSKKTETFDTNYTLGLCKILYLSDLQFLRLRSVFHKEIFPCALHKLELLEAVLRQVLNDKSGPWDSHFHHRPQGNTLFAWHRSVYFSLLDAACGNAPGGRQPEVVPGSKWDTVNFKRFCRAVLGSAYQQELQ